VVCRGVGRSLRPFFLKKETLAVTGLVVRTDLSNQTLHVEYALAESRQDDTCEVFE
jgi:hypothetical protein